MIAAIVFCREWRVVQARSTSKRIPIGLQRPETERIEGEEEEKNKTFETLHENALFVIRIYSETFGETIKKNLPLLIKFYSSCVFFSSIILVNPLTI